MEGELKIGTTGKAAFDIPITSGNTIIPKGSRVTITNIDKISPSWGFEVTDEHGNVAQYTGFDSVIPD